MVTRIYGCFGIKARSADCHSWSPWMATSPHFTPLGVLGVELWATPTPARPTLTGSTWKTTSLTTGHGEGKQPAKVCSRGAQVWSELPGSLPLCWWQSRTGPSEADT